jgi:hypothetical protein
VCSGGPWRTVPDGGCSPRARWAPGRFRLTRPRATGIPSRRQSDRYPRTFGRFLGPAGHRWAEGRIRGLLRTVPDAGQSTRAMSAPGQFHPAPPLVPGTPAPLLPDRCPHRSDKPRVLAGHCWAKACRHDRRRTRRDGERLPRARWVPGRLRRARLRATGTPSRRPLDPCPHTSDRGPGRGLCCQVEGCTRGRLRNEPGGERSTRARSAQVSSRPTRLCSTGMPARLGRTSVTTAAPDPRQHPRLVEPHKERRCVLAGR